jgi:hypothetical protein
LDQTARSKIYQKDPDSYERNINNQQGIKMAKIFTETLTIEISKIGRNNDTYAFAYDTDSVIQNLETVLQEILPEMIGEKDVIVEVKS